MSKEKLKNYYRRKRILQTLQQIWQSPLTIIEAPMGYGKTTAMKMFLQETQDVTILWKMVTNGSVSSFWQGFSRLFREIDNTSAEKLAKLGVPDNSIFMDEALRIIEDISFSHRTVLVIDDYHLLSAPEVDHFIELLTKMELPNLYIVILSREGFGENTTELALKGFCKVIGKTSFALSQSEIIEYYKFYGIKLDAKQALRLYEYTEGWISAVYLCMLSFLEYGRFEEEESLQELIEKAVYLRCSAAEKDFVLSVCIYDSFTLKQAEYLYQKEQVGQLLRQLIDRNAFITYDRMNRKYQMHNIFTGYLRRLFSQQEKSTQKAAFQAAGIWHMKIEDYIGAMEWFYKAADFDNLLTALEADKGNSLANEHKEKLTEYFSDCPVEIKVLHPWACLIYAINLFTYNEMELFFIECANIAVYIEMLPKEQAAVKIQLAGELELLLSFTKYNNIAEMSIHHQKACHLLKGPSRFIDKNSLWTFGSPSVLYMFYRQSGQLEQAVSEMLEAMPYYYQITAGHGAGAEYIMQAERYYSIGDFAQAEITMHKARSFARSQQQLAIEICAIFLKLRLGLMNGNLVPALQDIEQTRQEIEQKGQYGYLHIIDLCEGFIYSLLNCLDKIPTWIISGDLQGNYVYFPCYAFLNMVYAKSLLLSGEYHKLLGSVEQFNVISGSSLNLLAQIYTHLYAAAARYGLQHDYEAQRELRKAITIAAPDQLIMPFVENSEQIMDVLAMLEAEKDYGEFIGRIKKVSFACSKNMRMIKDEMANSRSTACLTDRELEISVCVAEGLSNHAIAQKLYVAEITVKKALQKIYAKLGISSRTVLARMVAEAK